MKNHETETPSFFHNDVSEICVRSFVGSCDYRRPFNITAEISARLMKQILLNQIIDTWRGIQPGAQFSPGSNLARAKNPSPVSSNRARIFSPAKGAEKSM